MGKYIYLYRGPASSPADHTPEQTAEIMAAWEKWMGNLGSALLDGGAPFGERTAVSDDGKSSTPTELNGYTIVEADSLEEARKHTADHPFLSEGKGRFVLEVFELVPM